jgi:hypothetical protein
MDASSLTPNLEGVRGVKSSERRGIQEVGAGLAADGLQALNSM